jgi:hypothetical protein
VNSVPDRYQALRSFAFGDAPEMADELLDLVLRGIKTATCSTQDEPKTSVPGERWIVLDGQGAPRCVIESTEVTYRPYSEVDAKFAFEEVKATAVLNTGARLIAIISQGRDASAKTWCSCASGFGLLRFWMLERLSPNCDAFQSQTREPHGRCLATNGSGWTRLDV